MKMRKLFEFIPKIKTGLIPHPKLEMESKIINAWELDVNRAPALGLSRRERLYDNLRYRHCTSYIVPFSRIR